MHRLFLALLLTLPLSGHTFETAPRISDREIIESLAQLKAGQRALEQRLTSIEKRFESIDKRFESIDHRFDELWNLILVLIAAIMGLIGFIIWDRKTALRPLEKRLDRLEADLRHDLDLQHVQGYRLTRLIEVLRELAATDKRLADLLRSFSLL